MSVRKAAVAGTWYPASASRLRGEVLRYAEDSARAAVQPVPARAEIVALIAPHAGIVYSGPVAGHAYGLLQRHTFDVIVLLGPSHYVGFDGAAIWPRGGFETPLGTLAIDDTLADALLAATPLLRDYPDAHAREHSLEMQLPFLATFAPQTPIVPIVMGFQTRETAFDIGDAIGNVFARHRALLVASSDLSHFYDATTAATLDARVLARVEALDDEGLMDLLERRPDHACGGGPMVSILRAARARGASQAQVLRYGDSGDVSGDKSSVVGYMAAAIWR